MKKSLSLILSLILLLSLVSLPALAVNANAANAPNQPMLIRTSQEHTSVTQAPQSLPIGRTQSSLAGAAGET